MRTILVVAVVTLASSSALADVVGPPMPIDCPAGSQEETNHCGTVCVIRACATDADCGGGEQCADRALCVEEVPCGGWGGTYTIAHAACTGSCADGSCQQVRACGPAVSGGDAGTSGPEHGRWSCGCRAVRASGSSAWWMALPVVALLARRRLRRGGTP